MLGRVTAATLCPPAPQVTEAGPAAPQNGGAEPAFPPAEAGVTASRATTRWRPPACCAGG